MRGNSLDIQKLYIGGNPASGGGNNNLLINGCLRVWQRAVGGANPLTSQHQYVADRWYVSNGSALFANRRVAHNTAGGLYVNEMLLIRLNGDTATTIMGAWQRLEPYDVFRLRGKTVTFSTYLRCGASFSATNSEATLYFITSANEDTAFGGTALGSGGAFPDDPVGSRVQNTEVVTVSTTPTRFSITVTIPEDAWQLQVGVTFIPTGTASDTADWLGMKQLQLEVGDEPTEFEDRPLALETMMCQRYYEYVDFYLFPSIAQTTTSLRALHTFTTPKRGNPTITELSGNARYMRAGVYYVASGLSYATSVNRMLVTASGSSFTASLGYLLLMNFGADAEL